MNDTRPDPDVLLRQLNAEERKFQRGALKIYVGMAAGVGKTYSMLSDAILEYKQETDIVAGYIEPHGRKDTDAVAEQLPAIPVRSLTYRDVVLAEFDLDAAIKRRPKIILIDELAHTNVPGSRHPKRWQDIEELLSNGINVWTTVNVQHIESLRDVVASITGVEVVETVPDAFISQADEFELVDIPPDELLQRLEEGKIYAKDKIETAAKNFFKKSNLVALREIVLRHTANTVEKQLSLIRSAQGEQDVWATSARLLVAISPNNFASKLVRTASRMAHQLKVPLLAVVIETPRIQTFQTDNRAVLDSAVELVERLGGEVIFAADYDVVGAILKVAREKNVAIIVAGKPIRSRIKDYIFGSVADDLIRRSGDIDIYVVQSDEGEKTLTKLFPKNAPVSTVSIFGTLFVVGVTTGCSFLMYPWFGLSNLIMVYLLGVLWVSSRYNLTEGIIASVLSVLLFDFCFVPPRWTFSFQDIQYVFTFVVMLVTALVMSTLTVRTRSQALIISEREKRTSLLLTFSKHLSDCRTLEEVAKVARETMLSVFESECVLYWCDTQRDLSALEGAIPLLQHDESELAVAKWVAEHKKNAGRGSDTLPGSKGYHFYVDSGDIAKSVLGLFPGARDMTGAEINLVEGLIPLLASALRRVYTEHTAKEMAHHAEEEEIKNILLSSVSHDLRAPLATISESASSLLENPTASDVREQANSILKASTRLMAIEKNVFDLTGIESGKLKPHLEWHSLRDVIDVAIHQTEEMSEERRVEQNVPRDFPLQKIDPLLLEQVFVNLFENVIRHTPPDTKVSITASQTEKEVIIEFSDNGPGIVSGSEERIFEKLVRGSDYHGFGLGLSISRAIIGLHGGTIIARTLPKGGATFIIKLPFHHQNSEKAENMIYVD